MMLEEIDPKLINDLSMAIDQKSLIDQICDIYKQLENKTKINNKELLNLFDSLQVEISILKDKYENLQYQTHSLNSLYSIEDQSSFLQRQIYDLNSNINLIIERTNKLEFKIKEINSKIEELNSTENPFYTIIKQVYKK